MLNKSIYDSYMFYVYGEVSNWQLYDLKYELQCMQQSNFGKSLVSFCYTISQYPEIPGRSLCSVSPRARLSPVIKYRGHDCLHLLYLPRVYTYPAYLCSHYYCLLSTLPLSSSAGHKTPCHHFSVLVRYIFYLFATKYLLSNNFWRESSPISRNVSKLVR